MSDACTSYASKRFVPGGGVELLGENPIRTAGNSSSSYARRRTQLGKSFRLSEKTTEVVSRASHFRDATRLRELSIVLVP